MCVRLRSVLDVGKFRTALLLGVVPIAMLIPRGDMNLSQTGAGSIAQPPIFTVVDLTSRGVYVAYAISDGQVVGFGIVSDYPHAMLWRGLVASVVDLHPRTGSYNGGNGSRALGISGGHQVGWAETIELLHHALLWNGSAESVVDLHPSWLNWSEASATSGEQQVGRGSGPGISNLPHALLWSGSAASAVDLHPNGFTYSIAEGVSGGQQVGVAHRMSTEGDFEHAILWRGTAASAIDLTPPGFSQSGADGVSGGQVVGWGSGTATGGESHALLWRGTADSVVDLRPSGFTYSEAHATNDSEQVGYGYDPARGHHALLWHGTAVSALDLHAFLPPGFAESEALGIDSTGEILGVAWVYDSGGNRENHYFLWMPAKKPGSPAQAPGRPRPVSQLMSIEFPH